MSVQTYLLFHHHERRSSSLWMNLLAFTSRISIYVLQVDLSPIDNFEGLSHSCPTLVQREPIQLWIVASMSFSPQNFPMNSADAYANGPK